MEFPKDKQSTNPDHPTPANENPAKEAKPRQKRDKPYKPRETNPDGPKRPRYEKPSDENPRPKKENPNRFVYPSDWKEQIDANTILETKIPALPKNEELVPKPDFNALRKAQNDFQAKIEKAYLSIDALKKEQKAIRDEAFKKNTSVFAELKEKKAVRQKLSETMKANKEAKEKLLTEIDGINEKIAKLQKNAFGGKIMDKTEIERLIKEKEEGYRNKQHTSTEEKKHIEEMRELKVNLPLMSENDKLRKEREVVEQKLKVLKNESKLLFDKIQDISGQINEVKARLDQQESSKANEEKPKLEEGAEKPKRELSQPEKEIREKIDKIFEDISRLRAKKDELSKKFDEDMLLFDTQQFEMIKIDRMVRIQKKLKYEETKKKRAEEDEKYKKEEEEKEKEMLQFKYRKEIDTCDDLLRILKQLKMSKTGVEDFGHNLTLEYKVDDKMLKEENLTLMKPKKDQEDGVKPGQKKFANKKKDKKPAETKDEGKVFLDVTSLQTFTDMKVMPPVYLNQIDGVIEQLNQKKNYFMKLREEEMTKALSEPKEVEEKENKEVGPSQTKEPKEKKRQNEGAKENKKKVEMTEADFPSLS